MGRSGLNREWNVANRFTRKRADHRVFSVWVGIVPEPASRPAQCQPHLEDVSYLFCSFFNASRRVLFCGSSARPALNCSAAKSGFSSFS